jgi:hypothetical protein
MGGRTRAGCQRMSGRHEQSTVNAHSQRVWKILDAL